MNMMYGQFKGYNPNSPGTRANAYSTGNRTYNGTKPSPQAGKGGVNPAGYQNRDSKAVARRNVMIQMANRYGGKA